MSLVLILIYIKEEFSSSGLAVHFLCPYSVAFMQPLGGRMASSGEHKSGVKNPGFKVQLCHS